MKNTKTANIICILVLTIVGIVFLLSIGMVVKENKPIYSYSGKGIEATVISTNDGNYNIEQ